MGEMNPEKEIVNWWLNKKGFFTINSIKVAKNKEIDILAIKLKDGKAEKIVHFETYCSISSVDNLSPKQYLEKFENKLVVNKVKSIIKKHIHADKGYEKALVLGATAKLEDFKKLKGINIRLFDDILTDVFLNLNKQNYRNEIIRTLQLVKFLGVSNPKELARIIEDKGKNKTMKMNTREDFLSYILKQEEVKRVLSKERFEKDLTEILKHSSLTRPEKFAKALIDTIMTTRTRNRFVKAMLEHKGIATIAKKEKKEKPLQFFFKK